MGEPITRWVEPCAGMLAVGLWLRGRCDPPIAWLGGKRWARGPILDGLGVQAGSGCADLWIADAGPAGRFWRALATDPGAVLDRLRALPEPATVDEARALYARLDREDPAEWLVAAGWSFRAGQADTGFREVDNGGIDRVSVRLPTLRSRVARAAKAVRGARIYDDARAIPVEVTGRTVVLLDPPYVDTAGYEAGLSRADVVDLAERWSAAGAEVLITERERVVPGWRAERLAGTATGSAGGKWEVLTLSPGARWAEPQGSLFAAPAMPERAPGGSAMTGGVGR